VAIAGDMSRPLATASARRSSSWVDVRSRKLITVTSLAARAVPRLLVRAVEEDGAAARAGIRTGDVLLNAGKRELRTIAGLDAAIDDAASAPRLKLTLLRGVDQHTVMLNLGRPGGRTERQP
jgi:S1-C subfamily serine protease